MLDISLLVVQLETPTVHINQEEKLPVSFLEMFNSRATPVPTLYAIRYFCKELESALNVLLQSQELQTLLSQREVEKDWIHDCLLRLVRLFQEFLMIDTRR